MTDSLDRKQDKKGILMLLICAIIWGSSFVAQYLGTSAAEPFTFNCARGIVATIFLAIICLVDDVMKKRAFFSLGSTSPERSSVLWKGGSLCGFILAIAVFFQQWGIAYTTVGKSGFITALYIVMVPIFGYLIFKTYVGRLQIISVAVAVVGLYFICINEGFTVNFGDMLTLICSFCFTMHVLMIDHYISGVDGIRFSLVQFAVSSIVSGIFMFIFESPSMQQVYDTIGPILYLGIMSNGVAYTLQVCGQKYTEPVLAVMLMSLESVFALFFGWLLLGQAMSWREGSGCILMAVAIVMAQLPEQLVYKLFFQVKK